MEDLKDSVDPEAPALLECIGTADALLNDLVRLGVVIRRAATKSHIEKADSKFNAKGPDLEALNSHLVRVALYRPTHLTEIRERFWKKQDLEFFDMDISEQRITLRHFGVNAGYPLLLNEATTVQKRLIMANLRRSHRFRYSQSHALKLGRTKPGVEKGIDQVQKITSTTTPEVKKADEIPSNSIEQPTNSIGIVLDSPPKLSNLNVESNFSGTTASAVDTNMMNIGRTSVGSSRQSHSEGTAITSRIKTQYPRPPRVEHNLFMCPCCCAPLQRKDSETRSWRFVIDFIISSSRNTNSGPPQEAPEPRFAAIHLYFEKLPDTIHLLCGEGPLVAAHDQRSHPFILVLGMFFMRRRFPV